MVLGVDPGLHCGMAELRDGKIRTWETAPLDAASHASYLARRSRTTKVPLIIAVERFTITGNRRRTAQPDALEVIGMLRFIAHTYTVQLYITGASDAQRVGNSNVLRALGWWTPGVDHLNQAAAQVAYTLARVAPKAFLDLVGPGMISIDLPQ